MGDTITVSRPAVFIRNVRMQKWFRGSAAKPVWGSFKDAKVFPNKHRARQAIGWKGQTPNKLKEFLNVIELVEYDLEFEERREIYE